MRTLQRVKAFATFFLTLSHYAAAQEEAEILSGGGIGGQSELYTFTGKFNPFALDYFSMLDYETSYLGSFEEIDHYVFAYSDQAGLFGTDPESGITYTWVIKAPSDLPTAVFLKAAFLNDHLLLFFEVKGEKKYRSLYCQPLDLYTMELLDPLLLDTYESVQHLNISLTKSPNGTKLAVLVNPDILKDKHPHFNLVLLNAEIRVERSLKNKTVNLSPLHRFHTWSLSNKGDLLLVYRQNAHLYSKGGIEKPADNIGLINCTRDSIYQELIELTDRKIQDCSIVSESDNSKLFLSWYHTAKIQLNGFSVLDLKTRDENPKVDFEYHWAEPFTRLTGNYYSDQAVCNQHSARFMNAGYSLIDIQEHDPYTTYLLEKKTNLQFFSADGGQTVLAIKNTNTNTSYNSDLFIVRTDQKGGLLEAAKIERGLFHGIFPGTVLSFRKDATLHVIYCTLANTNYEKALPDYKGIASNYEVNLAEINLGGATIEINKRTLNQFSDTSKITQFVPYLQTARGEAGHFTTLAFTDQGYKMLRILY